VRGGFGERKASCGKNYVGGFTFDTWFNNNACATFHFRERKEYRDKYDNSKEESGKCEKKGESDLVVVKSRRRFAHLNDE
jgi:hypothetical protein